MLIRYAFKKWSGARLLPLYLELKCIHKTMACNKNENRYKNNDDIHASIFMSIVIPEYV